MEQNILEQIPMAVDKVVDVSSSFPCNLCKKSYSRIRNLFKHQRCAHNVNREQRGTSRMRCPQENCEYRCTFMENMRHHLRNCHGIRVEEVELTFPSMSEFLKWREEEERSSNSKFVARSAVKKLPDGWRKMYLQCHRSGHYRSQGLGKRKPKAHGSCKMNRSCPASMIVVDRLTKVVVHYCKTHCGHSSSAEDVTHLGLTESERALIAGKLAQGITFENLLEDLRNNSQGKFNRFHLLTRKGLHNIQSSFKLQRGLAANGELDTWESWVQKSSSLGDECPILYCKGRGVAGEGSLEEDDFLLVICNPVQREMLAQFGCNAICIDVTDAGSSADFVLTSVVVVDEYGEPFPAAFCLSNRVDFGAYLCFFKALFDRVGKVTPAIFLSDNLPAVYGAWSHVMGEYESYYFCPWWTEQSWKTMLGMIPSGKKMNRTTTHRRLQALLVEMDMEKFHHELGAFLEEMQGAKETRDFASHFLSEFALRPEMWARCFMGPAWSSTMCSLENMHRALKFAFSKGKIFGQLIRCIHSLNQLVDDRNNDRAAKTNSCGEDDQNGSDILVEILEEDLVWEVKIASQESHRVSRTSNSCLVANCVGTTCIHRYSCSCTDYLGHEKSCGHIQVVAQLHSHPSCTTPSSGPEETNKTLARRVEESVETILGFLKKGKFGDDLLRKMHKQMGIWIDKAKNGCLTQPQMNIRQPTIEPENNDACNDMFVLIYPQQVSGTTNVKVPISRNKNSQVKKRKIVNVPSGFDHTY